MKYIIPIFIICLFAVVIGFAHALVHASPASTTCQNAINVQSYGAKGNGSNDDSNAIIAAITASKTYVHASGSANVYVGSSDPICFPAGQYRITKEIPMKGYANIYADGDATIQQSCSSCTSFAFHGGYTVSIKNMKFSGGKNQIYFDNANVDTTILTIENSEFRDATDYAIYTDGTTDGHLSAEITIVGSQFINSKKILRNVADHAIFRDTAMTLGGSSRDAAALWNLQSASIFFANVTASANIGGDAGQARWVDNNGNFFVDHSTFTGSNGGIPLVYQSGAAATRDPWIGKVISIRNSTIGAGNNAAIVLKEAVPQLVLMQNNSYTATHRIFASQMNVGDFVSSVLQSIPAVPPYAAMKPQAFRLQLDEDASAAGVPSELLPYVTHSST